MGSPNDIVIALRLKRSYNRRTYHTAMASHVNLLVQACDHHFINLYSTYYF
jgi:hypothetical protein